MWTMILAFLASHLTIRGQVKCYARIIPEISSTQTKSFYSFYSTKFQFFLLEGALSYIAVKYYRKQRGRKSIDGPRTDSSGELIKSILNGFHLENIGFSVGINQFYLLAIPCQCNAHQWTIHNGCQEYYAPFVKVSVTLT